MRQWHSMTYMQGPQHIQCKTEIRHLNLLFNLIMQNKQLLKKTTLLLNTTRLRLSDNVLLNLF